MEQWLFAQELGWLPAYGRQESRDPIDPISPLLCNRFLTAHGHETINYVTETFSLTEYCFRNHPVAIIARMTRSSMLEVMKRTMSERLKQRVQDSF